MRYTITNNKERRATIRSRKTRDEEKTLLFIMVAEREELMFVCC